MLDFTFTPFPDLETERLFVRQLQLSDTDLIKTMRTDPRVTEFIIGEHYPANVELFITKMNEATQRERQLIMWAIALKEDNKAIGTISLGFISQEKETAEVGCAMDADHWSKGYMNEAAMAVMKYAFDIMKLRTVTAFTHRSNPGSAKLLQKYGFVYDESVKLEGQPDELHYVLSNKS